MALKLHPACLVLPEMQPDEYEDLKRDIERHGVREPVRIHGGFILDGRHRWRACQELGIKCPTEDVTIDQDESLVEWVVSTNVHRRSLTASQRAAVAAGMLPLLEEEAKERQRRGKAAPPPAAKHDLPARLPEGQTGESREHAAKATGASPRYVQDAKAIKQASPETFEKVKSGEVSIPEAKRQLKKPPPPAIVKPKDKLGKLITDPAVVKAFEDDTLADIGRRIDALRREVEAIEGNPHLRAQQIAQDLQNAKNAVRFATPFAVCPKHEGKKCKPCAGAGWLPKDVYDRLEKIK